MLGLLKQEQAAEACGLSPRTLERWRYEGRGPRFAKLGKRVLYRPQDLVEWIAAHTRTSTRQAEQRVPAQTDGGL
jgi:hypothetical protein